MIESLAWLCGNNGALKATSHAHAPGVSSYTQAVETLPSREVPFDVVHRFSLTLNDGPGGNGDRWSSWLSVIPLASCKPADATLLITTLDTLLCCRKRLSDEASAVHTAIIVPCFSKAEASAAAACPSWACSAWQGLPSDSKMSADGSDTEPDAQTHVKGLWNVEVRLLRWTGHWG